MLFSFFLQQQVWENMLFVYFIQLTWKKFLPIKAGTILGTQFLIYQVLFAVLGNTSKLPFHHLITLCSCFGHDNTLGLVALSRSKVTSSVFNVPEQYTSHSSIFSKDRSAYSPVILLLEDSFFNEWLHWLAFFQVDISCSPLGRGNLLNWENTSIK